jgi:hypothetical protein
MVPPIVEFPQTVIYRKVRELLWGQGGTIRYTGQLRETASIEGESIWFLDFVGL